MESTDTHLTESLEVLIPWAKSTRLTLDCVLISMKEMQNNKPPFIGRNLSLSITHLEDSIMRLGQCLRDMDTPNPYPNSMNPTNNIIDPKADTCGVN